MELNVKAFPHNLQTAKKIAKFINRYCTEEDRAALLSELRSIAEDYQENKVTLKKLKSHYAALGSETSPTDVKRCEVEIRKTEALEKRMKRNIDLIEGRKK